MKEVGQRDGVEEIGGLEERGRGEVKGTSKIFSLPAPEFFFFLIEANSANQNAEY